MTDPLKALFGKPDYSHIVRDTTATISITAAEMAAVLEAHDRIDTLDGTRPRAAVELLGKLSFNDCHNRPNSRRLFGPSARSARC